jgi:hypothetical protein
MLLRNVKFFALRKAELKAALSAKFAFGKPNYSLREQLNYSLRK